MNNGHAFRYWGMALLLALLSLGSGYQVKAQEEVQPIEIIVPFGPGGGADQLARRVAPRLHGILQTPVVVSNIPGDTGLAGISELLERPADGHTISVLTADTFSLLALTPPPWNPDDINTLAVMMRQPSGLFVARDSRFKTWKDFEEEARARPYKLTVAITGPGSPDDITVNYLGSKDIKLETVSFANPMERYAAALSERVDALYEQAGDIRVFLDGELLRPLLFFSASSPPGFKDVPTARSQGHDITIEQFRALVIKAGTDPQQVRQLTEALGEIARSPEYQAYLQSEYALPDSYLAAQEAFAYMQKELEETKKWSMHWFICRRTSESRPKKRNPVTGAR